MPPILADAAVARVQVATSARVRRDVTAQLGWIDAINPLALAIVVRTDARALASVDRVDPSRGLRGLPVVVNETLGVSGLPQSLGRPELAHREAPVDAPVVRRLEAAQAVLVGLTNGPGGLDAQATVNPVYGRTPNPRGAGREAGGVAGGDAAAIATGLAPLAVTIPDAESVVRAAGWCGVCAHRPTRSRRGGGFALMARSIGDLAWAIAILRESTVPERPHEDGMRDVTVQERAHAAALAKCGRLLAGSVPSRLRLVGAPGVSAPRQGHRRDLAPAFPTWGPVTVVPVDCDAHGMPVAVAVVGPPGTDALTIETAARLESSFGVVSPVHPRIVRTSPWSGD